MLAVEVSQKDVDVVDVVLGIEVLRKNMKFGRSTYKPHLCMPTIA